MEHNIKSFISNFIDNENIQSETLDKDELMSLTLYFVFQKKYFKNNFDTMYLRSNYEGKIRLVTPAHNNVKGTNNRDVEKLTCAIKDDDEGSYEGIYFFEKPEFDESYFYDMSDEEIEAWEEPVFKEDKKYLKDKTIKNIFSVFNTIKRCESGKELKNEIEELIKNNRDAIFDFYNHMEKITKGMDNKIFKYLESNVKIENLESEKHLYILPYCKKKGIQFFKSLKNEEFDYSFEKEKVVKEFEKEIKSFRRLSPIVKDNHQHLAKIMTAVNNKYSELDMDIDRKEIEALDFYYFEVPANIQEPYSDKISVPKEKQLHNSDMFKSLDLNQSTFVDFVLENPFEINKKDLRSNAYQGMVYINKDTLSNPRHEQEHDYSYIVAKTKRNETAGVICITKRKESNKVYKIGEISIKNNFRNKGLATVFYKKIAEFCIENGIVLTNRIYSKDGEKYLPNMKQKIKEANPDFLLIDRNLGNVYDDIESTQLIENYHKRVLKIISDKDRCKGFNFQAAKSGYHKGFNLIKEEMSGAFASYENIAKAIEVFENEYERTESKQLKRKKLKL